MNSPIRIVIADDHKMVRKGLCALLATRPELEVVGEASNGLQACQTAKELAPHVVIMDAKMPEMNGNDATRNILKSNPATRVLFLSMHSDAVTVDGALRAGARGYVLKGDGVEELVQAIHKVHQGEVFLSPDISDVVLQGYLGTAGRRVDPLTDREREVLKLIAEGYSCRELATQLGIKPKTAENYRTRIADKLDIRTTAGLVRYALRIGLTPL